MILRTQMIPKTDRKSQSRTQMIPGKIEEWNGFYGTDYTKRLMIKKNLFLSPSKEKRKEDATSQVNSSNKAKKKEWIWKGYGFVISLIFLRLQVEVFLWAPGSLQTILYWYIYTYYNFINFVVRINIHLCFIICNFSSPSLLFRLK